MDSLIETRPSASQELRKGVSDQTEATLKTRNNSIRGFVRLSVSLWVASSFLKNCEFTWYLLQKRNFLDFWKRTHVTFLIVTSKRIKLESPAKSRIVGNSFAFPNLFLNWLRFDRDIATGKWFVFLPLGRNTFVYTTGSVTNVGQGHWWTLDNFMAWIPRVKRTRNQMTDRQTEPVCD